MPAESKHSDVKAIVLLYQRCRERNALPYPGGVLDQPEELMGYFDVIDQTIAAYKAKLAEEQRQTQIQGQLRAGVA